MFKKVVFLTLSVLLFSLSLAPGFAQEPENRGVNERAMDRTDRCEIIEARIETKIESFKQNQNLHLELYNKLKEKLDNIVARLEEKGLDVSKLKADIETLNAMVQDNDDLYTEFIAALRQTQQYVCGESEGQFKEELKVAIEKHKLVVLKRREIFEFYKTVVRGDIKQLRDEVAGKEDDAPRRMREEQ